MSSLFRGLGLGGLALALQSCGGARMSPEARVQAPIPESDFRVELHPRQMKEHGPCAKLLHALSDVGQFAHASGAPEAALQADSLSLYVWEGQGPRIWAWLFEGMDASYDPPLQEGVETWRVRPTTWAYGEVPREKRDWLLGTASALCAPDSPACAQFRGDFLRAREPRLREGPLAVLASGLLRLQLSLTGATCTPEGALVYADAAHALAARNRLGDVLVALQPRISSAGWAPLTVGLVGAELHIRTK